MPKSSSNSLTYQRYYGAALIVSLLAVANIALVSVNTLYFDLKVKSALEMPLIATGKLSTDLKDIAGHGIVVTDNATTYTIEPATIHKWLRTYTRAYSGKQELRLDGLAINAYLQTLAPSINQVPQNALLSYTNGQIIELKPSQPGQKLNVETSTVRVISALIHHKTSVALAVDPWHADLSLATAQALGVSSMLGKGESNFSGSPTARTHNIAIGAKIFNGVVIKPGEEFSFDKTLGPVDDTTGFLPELVIKKDKIIPEFGGGLCQVSTTLFRAAMASGLTILERHPHSLPVRYYNPQGYDAAIYPGSADLRFKNDTTSNIIIQSHVVGSKLDFELYGNSDGRQIVINPPQELEKNPDGSLKTILTRMVTYSDGTTHKDSFYSSYKSPQLFTTIRDPLE